LAGEPLLCSLEQAFGQCWDRYVRLQTCEVDDQTSANAASLPRAFPRDLQIMAVISECPNLAAEGNRDDCDRRSPRKFTVGLPGSLGGGPAYPPFGRKLFRVTQASSSVPSTVKCSSEVKPFARACATTCACRGDLSFFRRLLPQMKNRPPLKSGQAV
jgi:hypothetical protein